MDGRVNWKYLVDKVGVVWVIRLYKVVVDYDLKCKINIYRFIFMDF